MSTPDTYIQTIPFKIDLFKIIHDSRNHHGLRHQDYDTYRYFCSNKLRRIRKSMNIKSNGKPLYDQIPTDAKIAPKQLEAYLFESERSYAHAESLKPNMSHSPRTRFHVTKRLMRATQYSKKLLDCSEHISDSLFPLDPLTIIQCKIYYHWISSMYAIQTKALEQAKSNIISSMSYIEIFKEHQLGKPFSLEALSILEDPIKQLIRYISHQYRLSENSITQEAHDLSNQLGKNLTTTSPHDKSIESSISIPWIHSGKLFTTGNQNLSKLIKSLYEIHKPKILAYINELIKNKTDDLELDSLKSNIMAWREAMNMLAGEPQSTVSSFIFFEHSISKVLYLRLKSLSSNNSLTSICTDKRMGRSRKKHFTRRAIFTEAVKCLEGINQLDIIKENLLMQRTIGHMINIYQMEILIINALSAYLMKNYPLAAKCVLAAERQLDASIKDMPLYSACMDTIGLSFALESSQLDLAKHVIRQIVINLRVKHSLDSKEQTVQDPLSLDREPLSVSHIPEYIKEILSPKIVYLKPIFYDLAYDQVQYPPFPNQQGHSHDTHKSLNVRDLSESQSASSTDGLKGLLKRWWSASPINK